MLGKRPGHSRPEGPRTRVRCLSTVVCRQLITLHERNFQPFRHSRQPRSPRAINPSAFSLSHLLHGPECYPFPFARPASLIFLSPVRVYEYLIRQTGRTYSVNEAPRYSCSDLDKESGDTRRSSFRNVQRVTLRLISIAIEIIRVASRCALRLGI